MQLDTNMYFDLIIQFAQVASDSMPVSSLVVDLTCNLITCVAPIVPCQEALCVACRMPVEAASAFHQTPSKAPPVGAHRQDPIVIVGRSALS